MAKLIWCYILVTCVLMSPSHVRGNDPLPECPACTGGARQGCCLWKCFGGWFNDIQCDGGAVISITGAVYGVTDGPCARSCCPAEGDCTAPVQKYGPAHMEEIYTKCNNKTSCGYNTLQANQAGPLTECGPTAYSDYEIINYDCLLNTEVTTSDVTSPPRGSTTMDIITTTTIQPPMISSTIAEATSPTTNPSVPTVAPTDSPGTGTTVTTVSTTSGSPVPPQGLSTGAIVGIVFGVILLILLILTICFCVMVRRKNPNWPQFHNWTEPFVNIKSYLPGDLDVATAKRRTPTPIKKDEPSSNGAVRESNVTIVKTPQDAMSADEENVYYTIDDRVKSTRRPRLDSFNSVEEDFEDGLPTIPSMKGRTKLGPSLSEGGNQPFSVAISRDMSVRSENQYEYISDIDIRRDFPHKDRTHSNDSVKDDSVKTKSIMIVENNDYDTSTAVRDAARKSMPEKIEARNEENQQQRKISEPVMMVGNTDYDSFDNDARTEKPKKPKKPKGPAPSKPVIMISNTEYDTFPDHDSAKNQTGNKPYGNVPSTTTSDNGRKTKKGDLYTKVNVKQGPGDTPGRDLERYATSDVVPKESMSDKRGVPPSVQLEEGEVYENSGYESDRKSGLPYEDTDTYYNCDDLPDVVKTRANYQSLQDNKSTESSVA